MTQPPVLLTSSSTRRRRRRSVDDLYNTIISKSKDRCCCSSSSSSSTTDTGSISNTEEEIQTIDGLVSLVLMSSSNRNEYDGTSSDSLDPSNTSTTGSTSSTSNNDTNSSRYTTSSNTSLLDEKVITVDLSKTTNKEQQQKQMQLVNALRYNTSATEFLSTFVTRTDTDFDTNSDSNTDTSTNTNNISHSNSNSKSNYYRLVLDIDNEMTIDTMPAHLVVIFASFLYSLETNTSITSFTIQGPSRPLPEQIQSSQEESHSQSQLLLPLDDGNGTVHDNDTASNVEDTTIDSDATTIASLLGQLLGTVLKSNTTIQNLDIRHCYNFTSEFFIPMFHHGFIPSHHRRCNRSCTSTCTTTNSSSDRYSTNTTSTITSLNLTGCNIGSTIDCIEALSQAIRWNNPTTTSTTTTSSSSKQLVNLCLVSNNICDVGIEIICSALQYHPTIRQLDVSDNPITDIGIEQSIVSTLLCTNESITDIRLCDINFSPTLRQTVLDNIGTNDHHFLRYNTTVQTFVCDYNNLLIYTYLGRVFDMGKGRTKFATRSGMNRRMQITSWLLSEWTTTLTSTSSSSTTIHNDTTLNNTDSIPSSTATAAAAAATKKARRKKNDIFKKKQKTILKENF